MLWTVAAAFSGRFFCKKLLLPFLPFPWLLPLPSFRGAADSGNREKLHWVDWVTQKMNAPAWNKCIFREPWAFLSAASLT